FLNNTPVVAMLMPVVVDWAKALRISPSKLLIPLSYAAILGGLCSLIGTSTNLVVNGLLIKAGHEGMGMFDITRVGLPAAVVGLAFMILAGPRLLPDRADVRGAVEDPREYTLEMLVTERGPLVGKTVSQAGLRHLPGVYLMEIQRGDHLIPAVGPEELLQADDQLVFVGAVNAVVELQKIPGLAPATRQIFKLDAPRAERVFAEAVVARNCPVVGQTIRDGRFRTRYNAVVLAVARGGERIEGRIGDIVLEPGDALLLETTPEFVEQQRLTRDFYLVSRFEGDGPPTHERAGIAIAILAGMVGSVTFGLLDMLPAAFIAAGLMLATRCCSEETARRSIDAPLLIAIAASLGLGQALETTGAAKTLADLLLHLGGANPWVALAVIYFATVALSELVTNNAAAVLVFPIAMSTAARLGVDPLPFVMALMIAASAAFATPLGYQTHLMVYGAGGYRFTDFLRIGVPMDLVVGAVAVTVTPLLWPF
ncbi:MAG: SLC13 family permease, partial [Myxococcales bacterium]|nr:SLC13 family permease [Myxococcales bacterium]